MSCRSLHYIALRCTKGTTMATNSLMDLLEGKDLMEAFGWFQTYVGASHMISMTHPLRFWLTRGY